MAVLLSYALTDVESVKESLGIASSDHSKDNLIIRKINAATLMIENYCGRRFKLTTYTDEGYNGSQTDQIVLKNRPIVGDVALSVRDTTLNEDDFDSVESSLVFSDAEAGVLDLNFRAVGRWSRYKVTYQAGYTTIPDDIAEAAATLAAFMVTNGTSGTNVKRKTEGQRSIEYFDSQASANNLFEQLGIDEILNSYSDYPITGYKG